MRLAALLQQFPPAITHGLQPYLGVDYTRITHRPECLERRHLFVHLQKGVLTWPAGQVVLCRESLAGDQPMLVYPALEGTSQDMAIHLHQQLRREMTFIAVTGTNGKSTVVDFTRQLLEALQPAAKPASLGTLGLITRAGLQATHNTTPFPLDLWEHLHAAHAAGTRIVVMETSSHGLDQNRLKGLRFKVAAFTNITRDHLDYHGDFETYVAAKRKLIGLTDEALVINDDCPVLSTFTHANLPCTRFGLQDGNGGLRVANLQHNASGTSGVLHANGCNHPFTLSVLGLHNVSNALCAVGMTMALGHALPDILPLLAGLRAPRGRLEPVATRAKGRVIIDYAHTPDALEKAVASLRLHHPQCRINLLFGCGGNRDRGKRAIMGALAARLADGVYLTSDNPRNEDPAQILRDIQAGMGGYAPRAVQEDRTQAILQALTELDGDEILLLAGKGHEDYQERQGRKVHMNEVEICQSF